MKNENEPPNWGWEVLVLFVLAVLATLIFKP